MNKGIMIYERFTTGKKKGQFKNNEDIDFKDVYDLVDDIAYNVMKDTPKWKYLWYKKTYDDANAEVIATRLLTWFDARLKLNLNKTKKKKTVPPLKSIVKNM